MSNQNQSLTMHGIQLKENKHDDKYLINSHYHEVHQLLYVLENNGEINLDNKQFTFMQDSLAFITPYSNHSIIADTKLTVLVLEFEIHKLDPEIQQAIANHLSESHVLDLNLFEAGEIRQLLRRMLYEQSQSHPINYLTMKILLSELVLILLKSRQDSTITDANILRAERLRNYIDTHYFEVINSSDISTKIGLSVRHVNNIFKDRYNITPMQYLNEVRMETAKKLLIETNKDIASICFEIGFESLSTFYRTFKSYTNISPKKFRIANQIENITD